MSFKAFFSPERIYAVVGASSNQSKFGYKVLNWYLNHGLPVIPINPTSTEILNIPTSKSVIDAINDLDAKYPGNDGLSLSFITPPHVSLEVLNDIERNGLQGVIKGVWYQPGAYDDDVVEKSKSLGFDPVIENDDCILVSGGARYTKSAIKANL
jgi:predicted CoA-binding protein